MNWNAFITCANHRRRRHGGQAPRHSGHPGRDRGLRDRGGAGRRRRRPHPRPGPRDGAGRRDPALFREAVERIRGSGTDVVLNLTAGMGGDLVFGSGEHPLPLDPDGTDMAGPRASGWLTSRNSAPKICTLDCGTMNFAEATTL